MHAKEGGMDLLHRPSREVASRTSSPRWEGSRPRRTRPVTATSNADIPELTERRFQRRQKELVRKQRMMMASSNKLMKEINEQFLVCKICLESFKDPKILTCLHTFCCQCLQKHIDSECERGYGRFSIYTRNINCPLCRKRTEIPNGGVRRLPDNFMVSNLTEVINKKRSRKHQTCEICQTVNSRTRSNEACSKCLECSKLLCKSCVETHVATKVTQNHSIFDIEGEKDIECKAHPDEMVRFYCEPCEACVCIVCTFQEHRDHEVCSFSEGFGKHKAPMEGLLNQCKDRLVDVETRLNVIKKYESLVKDTREKIRDLAISYISQVRSTEKKLLEKVESVFGGADTISFLQSKESLEESLDGLKNTCSLTEIILKEKNIEMLVLKKDIEQKLSTFLEPGLPSVPEELLKQVQFVPGNVELGHIAVTNNNFNNSKPDSGSRLMTTSLKFRTKFAETQTDRVKYSDSHTSMESDLIKPNTKQDLEIDIIETAPTDVISLPDTIYLKENGSISDLKCKGVMTEAIDTKTIRCQTEKLLSFDREMMAFPNMSHVSTNTRIVVTSNKCINAVPSMINRACITRPSTRDAETLTEDSYKDPNEAPRRLELSPLSNPARLYFKIHSRGTQTPPLDNLCLSGDKTEDAINRNTYVDSNTNTDISFLVLEKEYSKMLHMLGTCIGYRSVDGIRLIHADAAVDATVDMRSTGSNPVLWPCREKGTATEKVGYSEKSVSVTSRMRDKETATPTRILVNSTTWTPPLSCNDKNTCTPFILTSAVRTQTPYVHKCDKAVDNTVAYSDVETTTPIHIYEDRGVQMETTSFDEKQTNTPVITLFDQAINACPEVSEMCTDAFKVECDDKGVSAVVASLDVGTFMEIVKTQEQSTETDAGDVFEDALSSPLTQTVEFFEPTSDGKAVVDAFTEMKQIILVDKDTSTHLSVLTDQWTSTELVPVLSTAIGTEHVINIDEGTLTDTILFSDQFTNTEYVEHRDNQTETVIAMADNETHTDTLVAVDAQTYVDVQYEDNATWMEIPSFQHACVMTDRPSSEYLTDSMIGYLTSTPDTMCSICKTNRATDGSDAGCTNNRATSCSPVLTCEQSTMALSFIAGEDDECTDAHTQTCSKNGMSSLRPSSGYNLKVLYEEKATSTESLIYMGLVSELDAIDELFRVPNKGTGIFSSNTSLSETSAETDYFETIDQEMRTDDIDVKERGTQTPDETMTESDIATDTEYDMSSETDTPLEGTDAPSPVTRNAEIHGSEACITQGTMTSESTRVDRSTNTARFNNRGHTPPIQTCEKAICTDSISQSDKDTMTMKQEFAEQGVTLEAGIVDEKMVACINKLRNVTEKLNSPTRKEFDVELSDPKQVQISGVDQIPSLNATASNVSGRESVSEEERKRTVMNLLAETQAIQKSRECRQEGSIIRKAQPITTLRGRPLAPGEVHFKSKSLPRQLGSREQHQGVKMGRQGLSPSPSRLPLLRYNSAPGRIATVPTHKPPCLIQGKPMMLPQPPKRPTDDIGNQLSLSLPKSSHAQLFKLPSITEIRTPSSCSTSSNSSAGEMTSSSSSQPVYDKVPIVKKRDKCDVKPHQQDQQSGSNSSLPTEESVPQGRKSQKGFMQRILSRKKKPAPSHDARSGITDSKQSSSAAAKSKPTPQSHPVGKEPVGSESPKTSKSKPFVYVRQRIFSIQDSDETKQDRKGRKDKKK